MHHSLSEVAQKCGFSVLSSEELVEIAGYAHVLEHDSSKAKLLYLQNEDIEKAFSIAFKTPAFDNTGVFHILEHSVLCGSKKFPVKEPFVSLLKSSMQTFLNAMTFPDKTMYPVATTNEKDLQNLMDVYLDAVFNPRIYDDENIFKQEGWHLETTSNEQEPVCINGVVFNEMKGALSDPEQVLYNALCTKLFPDTTYKYESGGDPQAIPNLTYDDFIKTHKRYYAPQNCYIMLYGSLDIETFLSFLDEKYLTPASRKSNIAESKESYSLPVIAEQQPTVSINNIIEMQTTPDNSCTAFGFVVSKSTEREKTAALSILLDALMGSNESPLKSALLKENIADDFDAFLSDSILQPFIVLSAKGLKENATAKMRSTIINTITQLCDDTSEGCLDEALVESAISRAEFSMREYYFGYPDGIMFAMSSMSGWLYDDNCASATSYIRYENLFKTLHEKVGTGYYRELLRTSILENNHHAQVELLPVSEEKTTCSTDIDTTANFSSNKFTATDLENIAKDAELLHKAQSTPDSKDALLSLPYLKRSDIADALPEPKMGVLEHTDYVILRHHVDTHGLVYLTLYFDVGILAFEDIPYVSLLASLLGKLPTTSHSASEIDILIQSLFGSLNFHIDVFEPSTDENPNKSECISCKFVAEVAFLEDKVCDGVKLLCEILTSTTFSDINRITNIAIQRKVGIEQSMSNYGHTFASRRAASYIKQASILKESISGIDFYLHLKRTIGALNEQPDVATNIFSRISEKLFTSSNLTASFGGSESAFRNVKETLQLPSRNASNASLVIPEAFDKHEAFIVPSDVTYSSLSSQYASLDNWHYTGTWRVLSQILNLDFLWNKVRVVGGAYGVGFSVNKLGLCSFYSYRDPHVSETLDSFKSSAKWLSTFTTTDQEFDGYVISATSAFDRPCKPKTLITKQALRYFSNSSEEERMLYRKQTLSTSYDDVLRLSDDLSLFLSSAKTCTIGNREIILNSDENYNIVDVLNEEL